jgi:type IV secretory pathway VirB10-like protein
VSISITINGDTASEAIREVLTLAGSMGMVHATATSAAALTAGSSDLSADRQTAAPAAAGTAEPKTDGAKEPAKTTRKKAEKPGPAAPPEPAPEVKAEDAADEAAESAKAVEAAAAEAKVDPAEVFDRNVMRNAGGDYAKLYGMPAAQEDGPKIIGYPAFSKVPDEEIEKATRALRAAIETNPYNRTKVA